MTALAQYERARVALAEATRVDEILPLRDEVEHLKLYARQIKDRALLAEAHDFQLRVERKLGIVLVAAKEAGQIVEGRPKKQENCSDAEQFPRVTLDEVGIDRKLSMRAQKAASISERAFEAVVQAQRERIAAGHAVGVAPINGARTVMSSRQEPDDSLDYFPTPPWATRALIERVLPAHGITMRGGIREPACGEGHIAEVLREYGLHVVATDIFDYGYQDEVLDYLDPANLLECDWSVTNPPFGEKALPFVNLALHRSRVGVAMFVRSQWAVEGIERFEQLFSIRPPTICAFFVERVNLCKGRWDPDGSTATAYCWLLWHHGAQPRPTFWIPPGCREQLSKPDDAARFTAHPVIRREQYDTETGEVSDTPPPPAPSYSGDMPDIPAFLRPEVRA